MQAVILAAGRGTRLHPITTNRTKAMLPILGKPMVRRVIDTIASKGIEQFIIVANPGDHELHEYFRTDRRVRIVEQPQPKGMAQALQHAARLIEDDFMLSACDNLVAEDDIGRMMARWAQEPRPNGLLALLRMPVEKIGASAVVELDGELAVKIIEKPDPLQVASNTVSLPFYLFSEKILEHLQDVRTSIRGEYELQDAIRHLIERDGNVFGLELNGRMTVTTAEDLLAINRWYFNQGEGSRPGGEQALIWNDAWIIEPVYIAAGVKHGKNCTIGPNVYLESGCTIGAGARVREAIILREATVPANAIIEGQVIHT